MRNFFILLFLAFLGVNVHAQSLSLTDLTNLATLSVNDGHNFLTQGKPFKEIYQEQAKSGYTLLHYKSIAKRAKSETIVIGDGFKSDAGTFLHIVNYTTTDRKYLLNLIAQANGAGLAKNFQGTDLYNSIYVFDNYLYTVRVFLKNDNSSGTIEIKQRDFVNYD
jgi:hypothetical protein